MNNTKPYTEPERVTLYYKQGDTFKDAGVFSCGNCNRVLTVKHPAWCCQPDDVRYPRVPCKRCGKLHKQYQIKEDYCQNCGYKNLLESGKVEILTEEEARKKYPDLVTLLWEPFTDQYYNDPDEAKDNWNDNCEDDDDHRKPTHLFLTQQEKFSINIDSIIEDEVNNASFGTDCDSVGDNIGEEAKKEIQDFFDQWCEKHRPNLYGADMSKAIKVEW